ncbi:DUF6207 family protein [Streptomyces caelestis]
MEPINEVHLAEPGLVVIDVAAVDGRTVFALSRRRPLGGRPLPPAAPRVAQVVGRAATSAAADCLPGAGS